MVKTLYSILHRSLDLTEFMEEVLIDDNMVFDIDNLKGFLNDTSSFGFIAKENNKIIGFAYCYTLLRPDGKTMFYLHSIGMLPNYQDKKEDCYLMEYRYDDNATNVKAMKYLIEHYFDNFKVDSIEIIGSGYDSVAYLVTKEI